MGDVILTRRFSKPLDITKNPSIKNKGLSTTSISFSFINNDESVATIFWEIGEPTDPRENQLVLNPGEESSTITVTGLIENNTYTIYYYALATNKRKTEILSVNRVPSAFLDGSSPSNAAPSTQYLITGGVTQDGFYYIDIPSLGPTQVYCDLSSDSVGWILMHCNDVNTPPGSLPPGNSVADFGASSNFWTGTLGSNEPFNVLGTTLTTALTEDLIANLPYKKIRFGGNSFLDAMDDTSATQDLDPSYFSRAPWDAVKIANVQAIAQNGNTTHAQKMTSREPFTAGLNAKFDPSYDQSWNEGFNAGEFLFGWFETSASAYGDHAHSYLGGRCDRRSLSSALWRNRYPDSGVSYSLHNNPTSIDNSLGRCYHRGGGNHANDSWWVQAEEE